ncbi:MAG TPA: hypothetical protein VMF07_05030 [Solirubrobacteraceae bacterium]|nr:hypothetical protein [Solirubrobacteraceae bacterium]
MRPPYRWPDAALAGLACSMRTFAGPGMLAARGRIGGRVRIAMLLAATGEIAMDKSPKAIDRTDLPALIGRMVSGGYTGGDLAGVPGAAAGSIASAAGTYATWRARGLVVEATGLPDPVVAVGEDLLAYGLAAVGTRGDDAAPEGASSESPEPSPRGWGLARGLRVGLTAGLAGTAVMTIAEGAEVVLTDAEPSGTAADVADKLKRRAGRGRLTRRHRRAANQGMHWLYGTAWGIPYGLFAAGGSVPPEASGPVFGLLVWMAGLVQLPALGVAEPPWKRSPASLASEAMLHVVYGIGAGAAVRALTR